MSQHDIVESQSAESQREWFWMVVSYMKMRTLAVWLYYYPNTPFAQFESIWPILFDQMLFYSTRATMKSLSKRRPSRN